MTTSYQRVIGLGPKPSKRGPKPKKRIARHVPVKRVSAKHAGVTKADAEWSAQVRLRADGYCERTGRRGRVAHHIFTKKAHPRLRYDVDNGVWLTRAAHREAHQNMEAFREWFSKWLPRTWARLQEKARREARLS